MRRAGFGGAVLAIAGCLAAACSAGAGRPAGVSARPGGHLTTARRAGAATTRTKLVSYHGVHVRVPAGWPVVDGMHTGLCGNPLPANPTVFAGPNDNGPLPCPYIPIAMLGHRDGVWLQPGTAPPGARRARLRNGAAVRLIGPGRAGPFWRVWFHRVSILIGVGRDPGVARAVLGSVGYQAGLPDTPAAGACARSANPAAMPQPRRLRHRVVIDQGSVTLAPPRPGDRPLMTAAAAWAVSGQNMTREPFERYRLLLARYTDNRPADLAGEMPLDSHGVLAWVIYVAPRTPIGGCGLWGLDVFDARTGQELANGSW